MRFVHGTLTVLGLAKEAVLTIYIGSMLHCSMNEFRRHVPPAPGSGRKARMGSSDPTSPRREASLFNLPGVQPGIFFARGWSKLPAADGAALRSAAIA